MIFISAAILRVPLGTAQYPLYLRVILPNLFARLSTRIVRRSVGS
jgi:hypothetical protein